MLARQSFILIAAFVSYRAGVSRARNISDRMTKRCSDNAAAIARMRQLHQHGGVSSLPEDEEYSAKLAEDYGLDKEKALGHVDIQGDDDDIDENEVGGVFGGVSSARLSPAQPVQIYVEVLSSE
jgi:hypothetical protein